MKICKSFLVLLLISQSIFCEDEESAQNKEEIVYVRSKDEALLYLLAQQKDKKIVLVQQRETLLQTITQVGNEIAPKAMPFLVILLMEYICGIACDKAASYVPNSYKLIDKPYLQINSQDVARIGLEGVSHVALWSLLSGARDEHNNFKLHFNRESVADGISASLAYAGTKHLLVANLVAQINKKYPESEIVHITPALKSFPVALSWAHEQNYPREWRLNSIPLIARGAGWAYDGVYQQLKKHYMQQ